MKLDERDQERMNRVLRHWLRNLASGIRTATCLLSEDLRDRLTPSEMEYFPLILGVCGRLSEITDRCNLYFDEIPPGTARDTGSVVADAAAALHGRHPTACVRCELTAPAARAPVSADRLLLVALTEALNNAAESAPGGEIVVRGRRARAATVLEVQDRGPGLTPEQVRQAFRPFYTTREQHLGLGLAIVRKAVGRLGGRVGAAPRRGGGLTVRLTLPHGTGVGAAEPAAGQEDA